jgi:hypothetical protein
MVAIAARHQSSSNLVSVNRDILLADPNVIQKTSSTPDGSNAEESVEKAWVARHPPEHL